MCCATPTSIHNLADGMRRGSHLFERDSKYSKEKYPFWQRDQSRESTPIKTNGDGKVIERVARLKFCPGVSCKHWLSISQFAKNNNTFSGFDKYCVSCNQKRRQQIKQRRNRLRFYGCITDELERFREMEYRNQTSVGTSYKRRVLKEFNGYIKNYNRFKHLSLTTFTPEKVYSLLFDGKFYICAHSGLPLSPACFLHHNHKISLHEQKNKCYLFCNGIKL